jgi:adenosylmethionine-8-amino-7-oxononanoate aminotransferase
MAFGTSLGGIDAVRTGYGPLVPSTSQVQWDSPEALADEIERVGPERVAAFFVEPVIGAGGAIPPPPGYVERVAAVCRDAGVLLVCDSVICGFGRLGGWYGFERFGITPDLVTFAKGVTSGYLPLGGVVVSGAVAEPFWSEPGRVIVRHGQTYAGHATVCAAALANIAILERERLIERGRELEAELLSTLAPLAEHPLVGEVRGGTGMIVGIAFDADALAADAGLPGRASAAVRAEGVILRTLPQALAVSPPLTIEANEMQLIHDAVLAGLDSLVASPVGAA